MGAKISLSGAPQTSGKSGPVSLRPVQLFGGRTLAGPSFENDQPFRWMLN